MFTTSEAYDAGVTRNRLRATDLHQPFRGVRSLRDDSRLEDRAAALLTVLPATAALSHQTCAALLDVPLPAGSAADLHVTLPRGSNRVRRPGVISHRADRPRATHHRLQVVTAAATWCDLGQYLGVTELVIAGDDLLHRGLVSLEQLRTHSAAHPSGRGRLAIRAALHQVRSASASPMETTARLRFCSWGLPEPELNVRIVERGGWIATVDFLWRRQRVIAEYYGEMHQSSWRRDLVRVAQLEDAGYRVLVITHRDLGVGEADLKRRMRDLLM
ncbi:DUF559 domain-containing protein [Allobranchiibius sp. GilTou38]|uniref:DUF559 domain-containing protein n=1 Tax=Allobranchiibius sp. GilTou38 TaxID=2815210 RepID=UPI001AA15F32|nr:DUF559 domain-containing protein [Allobranchiibius sp. GilTou38]